MPPEREAGPEPAGLGSELLMPPPGLAERAINAASMPDDEVQYGICRPSAAPSLTLSTMHIPLQGWKARWLTRQRHGSVLLQVSRQVPARD